MKISLLEFLYSGFNSALADSLRPTFVAFARLRRRITICRTGLRLRSIAARIPATLLPGGLAMCRVRNEIEPMKGNQNHEQTN